MEEEVPKKNDRSKPEVKVQERSKVRTIFRIITMMLCVVSIVLGYNQSSAYALFNNNAPTKFETDRGSKYYVETTEMCREKYDGSEGAWRGKNIYYATEQGSLRAEECAKNRNYYVEKITNEQYKMHCLDPGVDDVTFYLRHASPPSGRDYPVDMILKADGTPEATDRFHIGDKVVKEISGTPTGSCRR